MLTATPDTMTDQDRIARLEEDNADLRARLERLEMVLAAAAGAVSTIASPPVAAARMTACP